MHNPKFQFDHIETENKGSLLDREQIHIWMLSIFWDTEQAALIDLGSFLFKQGSKFPSCMFGFLLHVFFTFYSLLIFVLVVSHILHGRGVENTVFSGLRIQWQCSGIAWRSREEDVKLRGRMLKRWVAEDKESRLKRLVQECSHVGLEVWCRIYREKWEELRPQDQNS